MSRIIQEKEKMGQNAFYVWSVLKLVRRKHYKRDTVDNLIKDRESRYDDLLQYVSRSCNGFFILQEFSMKSTI